MPENQQQEEGRHGLERAELARIALAAAAAAVNWFHLWQPFPRFDLIAVAALAGCGWPIWREALEALFHRRMTMELSMTIAVGAAAAIGEWFTALVIVLFVLVAEVLEDLTVNRGRKAIEQLVEMLPRSAIARRDGVEQEVAAADLREGEVVVVKPGARIPADGVVVGGHSFVDQATITGESMPVEKLPDAQVFAGTVNQSGALDVRTTGVGRNTAFGRIIEAVERAEHSRAPIQKTADRLAGYLVYFALACAAFTFFVTRDVKATISVVIVAGACGIAAGTPLAILGAIGRAARMGSIIKGGRFLETLGRVRTVVFDKTGTLTLGEPRVTRVVPFGNASEREVLLAAAIAEKRSEHPLAKAVLDRAAAEKLLPGEPEKFQYQPGLGISCVHGGKQILVGNRALLERHQVDVAGIRVPSGPSVEALVASGGRAIGAIHLSDALRPEAKEAVQRLHELGMRTVLLTGDALSVALAVNMELQLDEVRAELLPEQKQSVIRELQGNDGAVAMVGDGVNDAPALVEAGVGVAMGSGTAVAMESADVVLIGNDLGKFVETVQIARRCRAIILQNFAGTLAVDGVGVALAAFGFLNPLLAAFIHVASELAFILNSTRLLPGRRAAAEESRLSQQPVVRTAL